MTKFPIFLEAVLLSLYVPTLLASSVRIQSTSQLKMSCVSSTDCEDLSENATCVAYYCRCGTDFCESTIERRVTRLGRKCRTDAECVIPNASCRSGACSCIDGFVEIYGHNKCLAVSRGLDDDCEDNRQCNATVSRSVCDANKKRCVCPDNWHEIEKECFPKALMGDNCVSHMDCHVIPFARCLDGRCKCKTDTVSNRNRSKCLDIVKNLSGHCDEDVQCASVGVQGVLCVNGFCDCPSGLQASVTRSKCVKNLQLERNCLTDKECSDDDDLTLHCANGLCVCKEGLQEQPEGYCSGGSTSMIQMPTIVLFIVFYLFLAHPENLVVSAFSCIYGFAYYLTYGESARAGRRRVYFSEFN